MARNQSPMVGIFVGGTLPKESVGEVLENLFMSGVDNVQLAPVWRKDFDPTERTRQQRAGSSAVAHQQVAGLLEGPKAEPPPERAQDIIYRLIRQAGGRLSIREIQDAFEHLGRSRNSAQTLLQTMSKDKKVLRPEIGIYELGPNAPTDLPTHRAAGSDGIQKKTGYQIITEAFRENPDKEIKLKDFEPAFQAQGLQAKSISPLISKATHDKIIMKVAPGTYTLTETERKRVARAAA